jgi:flagellum-specific ATP synthase
MLLSTYENMAELIRIGAYKKGSDPAIDDAVHYYPALEEFLKQGKGERSDLASSYAALAEILGSPAPG